MKRLIALLLLVSAACSSDGTRDMPPRQKASPESQSRTEQAIADHHIHLVALGDSLAFGTGDEDRRGITGRIEAHLVEKGVQTVTTTNLGVNGAQTADVMAKLSQEKVRKALRSADAVLLSVGANDLFRSPGSRQETLRAPFAVAEKILARVESIVEEVHRINPEARVLILGGYNPVPWHEYSELIDGYLGLWDQTLSARFAEDELVTIVKMSDIVTRDRLSRFDSFHPGGKAYDLAARRIAQLLIQG